MLKVTIELVPGGFEPLTRTIASMRISNASDLANVSDYAIDVMEGANPLVGTGPRNASCLVERHDRRQSVWALVAKAAETAVKAEFDEL